MRTLRKCTVLLCMLQPTINISALVPPPDFGHGTPLLFIYISCIYDVRVLFHIFNSQLAFAATLQKLIMQITFPTQQSEVNKNKNITWQETRVHLVYIYCFRLSQLMGVFTHTAGKWSTTVHGVITTPHQLYTIRSSTLCVEVTTAGIFWEVAQVKNTWIK